MNARGHFADGEKELVILFCIASLTNALHIFVDQGIRIGVRDIIGMEIREDRLAARKILVGIGILYEKLVTGHIEMLGNGKEGFTVGIFSVVFPFAYRIFGYGEQGSEFFFGDSLCFS